MKFGDPQKGGGGGLTSRNLPQICPRVRTPLLSPIQMAAGCWQATHITGESTSESENELLFIGGELACAQCDTPTFKSYVFPNP